MAAISTALAKAALHAAQSKTGRRVLIGVAVTCLVLPIAVVGIPVGLATAGAVAFSNSQNNDDGDNGEAPPVCEDEDGCAISEDAQEVAKQIVAFSKHRQVTWLDDRFLTQVKAYADGGTVSPDCTLDIRVLQIIVIAVHREGSAGVSSLNRRCTGQTPGAGRASYHWKGKAVDFYALGGTISTGADRRSVQLVEYLGSIVPKGSGAGQKQCRANAGISIPLGNFITFNDGCNHQHIQVSLDNTPLRLPNGQQR